MIMLQLDRAPPKHTTGPKFDDPNDATIPADACSSCRNTGIRTYLRGGGTGFAEYRFVRGFPPCDCGI